MLLKGHTCGKYSWQLRMHTQWVAFVHPRLKLAFRSGREQGLSAIFEYGTYP